MKNLHITQKKILDFLKQRGGSIDGLSLRDIGEAIGIGRRPQAVAHHLHQLEKVGLLRRDDETKNYIILDTPVSSVAYIKLYSCTAECGPKGLLGDDNIIDNIPLPTRTFGISDPNDFFLIKARGNSMEPTIKDGDLVLAKIQPSVPSGCIAVVVHDGMPKIKKLTIENINEQPTYCLESTNNNGKYPREYITNEFEGLRMVGIVKSIISKAKIE